MTQVVLIRHAKTEGNLSRKYIGTTDEPLCREGREDLQSAIRSGIYPVVQPQGLLFVSPMRRCRETASLIYPEAEQHIIEEFRECDFGEFEYKNHVELQGNEDYQAWIDSGGRLAFPGGEEPEQFRNRSVAAFRGLLEDHPDSRQLVLVVHGGTIMSVMSAIGVPKAGYFECCVENGHGFVCEKTVDGRLLIIRPV